MIKIEIKFLYFLFTVLLFYIVFRTGLHGDDLIFIDSLQNKSFIEFLSMPFVNKEVHILTLPSYYYLFWAYWLFGLEHQILYDFLKALFLLFSFYFIFKFCSAYLNKYQSIIFALLFIFYPSHDTTVYWYVTNSYIFVPALIMYSHYLINRNNFKIGIILAFLSSFAFYTSPPFVFGLSLIFFLNKQFKKFIFFIIPGVCYLFYYFLFFFFSDNIEKRISSEISILEIIKNITIQFLSSIDSVIGPSFWLKIFWSFNYLSLFSFILSLILVIFFILTNKLSVNKISTSLLISFFSIFLLSILMLAVTGLYTQTAFNLGNRVTIYASLFVSFIIVSYIKSKKVIISIVVLFVFTSFGISDYWKLWNNKQNAILYNIENNHSFLKINSNDILIISNNIYSKFGPFDHIEFFSMPWIVETIFKDKVKTKKIIAITSHTTIKDNQIIDRKYHNIIELNNSIYLYDSEKQFLKKIQSQDLINLVEQTNIEKRHWTQLYKIPLVNNLILYLNPSFKHFFKTE